MPIIRVDLNSIDIDIPSWIIGFIEGEGSFTKNGKYPVFALGQGDVYTLSLMREFLGVGSIRYNDSKHVWYYSVYGRKCWVIRNLCEGKLLLDKKRNQFEKWKGLKWLQSSEKGAKNSETELKFADWLRGFIEAEGSFTRAQRRFPEFSLAQLHERKIFDKVKAHFGGIGNIRRHHKENAWQYTVTSTGCWIVRDFCEGKLISRRKRKQFEDWKTLEWTSRDYVSQIIPHEGFSEFVLKDRFSGEIKRVYEPSGQHQM